MYMFAWTDQKKELSVMLVCVTRSNERSVGVIIFIQFTWLLYLIYDVLQHIKFMPVACMSFVS